MLFIVFNNEILLPYDGDVVAVVLRWTEHIDEGFNHRELIMMIRQN